MIQNIKSNYFVRVLFFHLSDEKKLKICQFNKILIKLLYLDILDYKICSRKSIILNEGKGREYSFFNNKILFEGE